MGIEALRTVVIAMEEFRRIRLLDLPELLAAMRALNADVAVCADDERLQIVV